MAMAPANYPVLLWSEPVSVSQHSHGLSGVSGPPETSRSAGSLGLDVSKTKILTLILLLTGHSAPTYSFWSRLLSNKMLHLNEPVLLKLYFPTCNSK